MAGERRCEDCGLPLQDLELLKLGDQCDECEQYEDHQDADKQDDWMRAVSE